MVEPVFLVGLAAAFLFILVFILRSTSSDSSKEQLKKEKKQKPIKERKPKGPKKNALKKEKRPNEVREWSGVDTAAKDAHEMLEFLKGKDPAELAKHQKSQEKQQINNKKKQPKKGKTEEAVQTSPVVSTETALTEEGFSIISKKADKKKEKGDAEKKNEKTRKPKPFFKPAPGEEGEQKNEKKPRRERQERRPQSGDENVEGGGEKRVRVEGEQENRERRPRRERPEGEEGAEDKPRRERQERPVRKPLPTVAPIVKYEQADLNDILNSITQDYKPKPKAHRISTLFSKIPRNIVITILSKLEARDLIALSEVNHYFSSIARKDSLWKDLLLRDFGVRDLGKYKSYRAAYRGEYKRKKQAAKKKVQEVKEIVPQDESMDSKAKKDNKKAEAPKEVEQATNEEETKEEQ